jgi:hypothetical protein
VARRCGESNRLSAHPMSFSSFFFLVQSHLETIGIIRLVENVCCVHLLHDNPTSRSLCYNGRDVRHKAMKSKKKMKVSTNLIEGSY